MFNRYKTKGVFLALEDRGESSKFLTAYTKGFGKIKLFGKSIRKKESKLKFGAGIFILNEIEFIEGKNYRTLTDIKIIDNFETTKKDLNKTFFAHKACEDLNALTREEQKDKQIWFLLSDFLKKLNMEKSLPEYLLYFRFFWKLVFFLGYCPELYNCVFCSKIVKKEPVYFSFKNGGIVGSCCFEKEEDISLVKEDSIKILRILLKQDEAFFSKLKISLQAKKDLKIITEKYLNYLEAS